VVLSGKKALCLAPHMNIDLALIDAEIRDLQAGELFTKLHEIQPHVRGILCTWDDRRSSREEPIWDGIFSKAADFTLLLAEVRKVCPPSLHRITDVH
jgi:hypothetical protein